MKNKYLLAVSGLLVCLGVQASAQVVFNTKPTKVFGQSFLPTRFGEMVYPPSSSPNRTKSKSLYSPYSVAVDTTTSPASLYVADTGNNRVLGWRDATGFTNGAPADLVIGQKDFDSAVPYGVAVHVTESATNTYDVQALKDYPSGLRGPSSIVYRGDYLFVMDAGNNRILRFRRPFETLDAGEKVTPDLVIGQPDLKSSLPNQSAVTNAPPTAATIRTSSTTIGIQSSGITTDVDGNLWLADSGNHRILRYGADKVYGSSNVADGAAAVEANLVLGQADFVSAVANPGSFSSTRNDIINKSAIRYGGPLAFDSVGNLFFADDLARVLLYAPPFSNGKAASRILGVYVAVKGVTAPPAVNDITYGFSLSGTTTANAIYAGGPRGLFCIDENLFVIDSLNNRIVRYDPAGWWPKEDLAKGVFSPHMAAVFGQNDFNSRYPNTADFIEPNQTGYNFPVAATYANGEVYVVESGNNRVTARPFDSSARTLGTATRLLGQLDYPFKAANYIEGAEFSAGTVPGLGVTLGPSLVVDRVSATPHLYIADTANNRVLCFRDARTFTTGSFADIVIGQVDHYRSLINSPYNNPANPNPSGLYQPGDVAVDAQGNLWVSDTGNGRVLRYPNPFERTEGPQEPDLVLGAPDFTSAAATTPSRDRMYFPVGLAFTPEGNLAVGDIGLHRVLLFKQPSINGQSADVIFGQSDGSGSTAGNLPEQLNSPRGIAIDSYGRLFVADTGNSRVQVWDDINNAYGDGIPAPFSFLPSNVGVPMAVTIDPKTEAIWVADSGNLNRVLRFPSIVQVLTTGAVPDFSFQVLGPRRVALDARGNPMVMDAASRVTMYFPRLSVINGVNGFTRVAPAMIASLKVPGVPLASEDATATSVPLPTNVGDVEVLVNGVNAPMTKVSGETADLIIPKNAPGSGTAEFLVRQVSTGEILGFDRIAMSPISPGIMYQSGAILSQGAAKALNQDGTENSASSPAKIDQELTVFLTGYGNFDGLPDDGTAPGSEMAVPGEIRVFLMTTNATSAREAQVISSTLDPDVPGRWRVKFKVPTELSTATYIVNMLYKSTSTLIPPGYTTIQVRPLVAISR